MRILIVGGGIAGLTLAAKLQQQGRVPTLVERAAQYKDIGYGIGLYPLGSCVLHGLGVYDQFVACGLESRSYEIADCRGRVLQQLDLELLTNRAGPMIMLRRSELVEVLRAACGDLAIRMGTTVRSLEQDRHDRAGVRVTLSDGSQQQFDLVVGCDGIDSQLRPSIPGQPQAFDTGWTVWTWWGRADLIPSDRIREYWGRGWFFGIYPVPQRCMLVAGLPNGRAGEPSSQAPETRPRIAAALAELADRDPAVAGAVADADTLFPWPMRDVRAARWWDGRLCLCGDAAAAFLPTAGVGASNAMRAAAALADELSKADAAHVPLALERFARRCRRLVEANQDDSRAAARYMFVKSRSVGWGRDLLLRVFPAQRVVRRIVKSMREPF